MYNLLVVDDEWVIREGLEHTVPWKEWNINLVQTAKNGEEALSILKEKQIDILLTDIRMPSLSGLELIKEIKKISSNMKVIILTGHNEFDYAQQAIRLQTDDYLLKPTDFKELERVMKKMVIEIEKSRVEKHELISLQISRYLSKPSSEGIEIEMIENADWFSPMYRMVKVEFIQNQNILPQLDDALVIEKTKQMIMFLCYNVHVRIDWQETIDKLVDDIEKNKLKATLYMSLPTENLEQLMEMYNQTNAAADPIYETELIHIYEYRNNKVSLKLEEVITCIKQNYDSPINQAKIAEELYMSNSNFSKLFKQKTGQKFSEYLTNIRIDAAKQLLKNTSLKTYEIANEVGYSEPRYFSQTFKKNTSLTPMEYRELKQE